MSLLDLLDPSVFTLLSAGAPPADTAERFASWSDMVRIVEIEAPTETPHREEFTKAFGDALFLVRPDGYIAATADGSEPEYIEGFLRDWLSPAAEQDNEPHQEELPLPPDEPMPSVSGSSASA